MEKYPIFSDFPHFRRRLYCFAFMILWVIGLFCGILLSLSAGSSIISRMRSSLRSPVSIISLLGATVFPLLLSAYAVIPFKPKPLLAASVCFFKALVHGYSSMLLYRAFGNYGWLIRFLLLFHGCISSITFFFFVFLCFEENRQYLRNTFWFLFALDILAASAEYRFLMPVLAYLDIILQKG